MRTFSFLVGIIFLLCANAFANSYNSLIRAGVDVHYNQTVLAVSPDNQWLAVNTFGYAQNQPKTSKAHIKVININNPSDFYFYYDSAMASDAQQLRFTDNSNLAVFSLNRGKLNYDLLNYTNSTNKHIIAEPDSIVKYFLNDDASILVLVDSSKVVYNIDISTGKIKNQIQLNKFFLNDVFFSPDKSLMGIHSADSVFIFNSDDYSLKYKLKIRASSSWHYFYGNDKLLAYDYDDATVTIFDLKSGFADISFPSTKNPKYIQRANFSQNGYLLLTGRQSEVWDVKSSKLVSEIWDRYDYVLPLNKSDSMLIIKSEKIEIWDYKSFSRKNVISDNYWYYNFGFLCWGDCLFLNKELYSADNFNHITQYDFPVTNVNTAKNTGYELIGNTIYFYNIPGKVAYDSINFNDYFTGSRSKDVFFGIFPEYDYFVSIDDTNKYFWKVGNYKPIYSYNRKFTWQSSPKGQYFISPLNASDTSKIFLHKTSDGSITRELQPRYYQFSSDDKYLLRRMRDTFEISDAADGSIIKTTFFPLDKASKGKVSGDLKYYVYCLNQSHQLNIYNLMDEKAEYSFTFNFPEEFYVWDFLFTRNLEKCLISFTDGSVMLLNSGFPNAVQEQSQKINDMISISPNPATDFIEINVPISDMSFPRKRESMLIFDVFGREVNPTKSQVYPTPALPVVEGVRLDVSALSPGLYFVRVGERVWKFVKVN